MCIAEQSTMTMATSQASEERFAEFMFNRTSDKAHWDGPLRFPRVSHHWSVQWARADSLEVSLHVAVAHTLCLGADPREHSVDVRQEASLHITVLAVGWV